MGLTSPSNLYNVCGLINPLNAELNPICHLLVLLGGATIVVVSRLRVNDLAANDNDDYLNWNGF